MVRWCKQVFNEYGVLQVTDKMLEDFAYRQLKKYKDDYFREPHALDVEDFVENYLRINIEYQKLSPNKSLLGLTAITSGIIPIIDSETGEMSTRHLEKGTICIDLDSCNNNEGIVGFTTMHEAAHAQFDMHVDKSLLNKKNVIEEKKTFDYRIFTKTMKTQNDWMEYHANKYACYVLMPASFVKKLYKLKHDEIMIGQRLSIKKKKLIWKMVYAVANVLNVSATAMAWRFLSLKIISKKLFDALEINKNKPQ